MRVITRLNITREQLKAPHYYYNGCAYNDTTNNEEQEAANTIQNLAADVLINILENEYKENR